MIDPPPRTPEGPADARSKPGPEPGKGGAGAALSPAAEKPALKRPDPTRYGDWEKNGRCIDF